MPFGLRLWRRRRTRVGDVATAAFRVASQTIRGVPQASPVETQSSLAAKSGLSNQTDESRATTQLVPPSDLWDEAYEALSGANNKLVEQYEESIVRIDQGDAQLAPVGSIARQEQLSVIISKRLDAIEKDESSFTMAGRRVIVREQFDKFVKIVICAKDFVSSAVSVEPHAALAWAGICVLLPVSTVFLWNFSLLPKNLSRKQVSMFGLHFEIGSRKSQINILLPISNI